ncbi:hypothetical protein N9030_01280 [bacterium]|nr:hypothetical protein [bacterium]
MFRHQVSSILRRFVTPAPAIDPIPANKNSAISEGNAQYEDLRNRPRCSALS